MGLGDFFKGVGEAGVNLAKGVAYVARPDHWDDIAEGAGKAVEFVAEHPGQAWDTAFEVGRAVVKDQMDPVNLAINAGLLAATVASGGAAAPAFIAKLGLGAKSLEAGVTGLKVADTIAEGAKVADTVIDTTKAVQTGVEAFDAGTSALKAADTVADVAKTADTVTDAAQTGSRAMDLVDKGLGLGEKGKWGTRAQRALNPLENSGLGASAFRERAAGRILEAGGETPGLVRQATAAFVQGGGHGTGMVKQLPGMSDKVHDVQKMAQRAQAVGKRLHQADQVGNAVDVAADPMSAVQGHANDYINSQTHAAGYTDRGQTAESMYSSGGDSEQLAIGPGSRSSAFAAGTAAAAASSQVAGPGNSSQVGTPGNNSQVAAPGQTGRNWRMQGWSQPGAVENSSQRMKGGWKPRGDHFWEGPRSQWAGGIGANYDWRPVDPLRPISAPSTHQAGMYKKSVKERSAANTAASSDGDLSEQGAPANFAPEIPKSGDFAMSVGQQPAGSAFPTTRFGETSKRSRLRNVSTMTQPLGAIGPNAGRTGNAVIDADSSSPQDYGVDNSGQGYFDFGNTMGTAAVGEQPNTSPMYQTGSRASRRGIGPGTLGV